LPNGRDEVSMKLGRLYIGPLLVAALFLLGLFLLSSCGGAFSSDQNTFSPEGDVAKQQKDLFLLVMWPALAIMIGVFGALLYIVVRFRRKHDDDPMPKQVHGNTQMELAWTIAPTLLLIAIAVPTLLGIVKLGRAAGSDAMHVTVIGSQWAWEFEYTDIVDADGNTLKSDQLYVPVDQEVEYTLHSLDVIHSFWVPKLAGKQDVVPGRSNRLKFTAEAPGAYSGQCAEFCGVGHPVMRLTLNAVERDEFDAWVAEQLGGAPAGTPSSTPEATPAPTP
jgi:cytochrome c oxidase subunit 2